MAGSWSPLPGGIFVGETLQRVLPIAQTASIDKGRLTLISLEIYEDGSLIRFHCLVTETPAWSRHGETAVLRTATGVPSRAEEDTRPPEDSAPWNGVWEPLPFSLQIEDDTGTKYATIPRGWSAEKRIARGEIGFTPPPPDTARTLRITVQGGPSPRRSPETPQDQAPTTVLVVTL
jgi:hypothetical protein